MEIGQHSPVLFPFPHAPNGESLVSAEWLQAALESLGGEARGPRAPALHNKHLLVLEVSWATLAEAAAYHAGHVPGALHLNTDDFEDGYPTWRLRPLAELQTVIGGLGLRPATTVVVYSHQPIAAARAWWVLTYAGVEDVRILNGGYGAWVARDYPGESTVNEPSPCAFIARGRPELLATPADIRFELTAGTAWLADVRSAAEFDGAVSGYAYLDRRGRLPGAIHVGDAADEAHIYSNADGTFRDPAQILANWAEAGIRSTTDPTRFDREVIVYCGSGWRSSAAFFATWLMGYTNIRNFSDGWCGWSTIYTPDPTAGGSTPGWRQDSSANPIIGPTEERAVPLP